MHHRHARIRFPLRHDFSQFHLAHAPLQVQRVHAISVVAPICHRTTHPLRRRQNHRPLLRRAHAPSYVVAQPHDYLVRPSIEALIRLVRLLLTRPIYRIRRPARRCCAQHGCADQAACARQTYESTDNLS